MLLPNLGPLDRAFRVLLGAALLAFGLARGPETWWGWLGILPLATGLAGYCPLYELLHVRTRGRAL
ncbi:DUF2892 domain-containing protein [Roseisolibacter sp. H3M3-2]|uniref:YgaP family membrane protein n=1 Tax=Roseisolibacter sp. H3M3-2 TaxID=3031323 RepID=UPI0023DC6E8F|nr:DUF2892 domain-containing protein [Roseisolibacter sp. H3M3-2]MDF1504007.1 DUF2892 domain-containing protein [Roseisolibacter sp. H3M3-2]